MVLVGVNECMVLTHSSPHGMDSSGRFNEADVARDLTTSTIYRQIVQRGQQGALIG